MAKFAAYLDMDFALACRLCATGKLSKPYANLLQEHADEPAITPKMKNCRADQIRSLYIGCHAARPPL
jgi:hypothetical protein